MKIKYSIAMIQLESMYFDHPIVSTSLTYTISTFLDVTSKHDVFLIMYYADKYNTVAGSMDLTY